MVELICEKCGTGFKVKPYREKTARFCSRKCAGTDALLPDRFWSKVGVRGDDECWLWLSGLGSTGYGQISIDGKPSKSHRVAFELTHGAIKDGMCVLHSCDTPRCCNPKHLFLGTQSENMADMARKKRAKGWNVIGEKHHNAKLTTSIASEIKASPLTARELALKLKVSRATIYNIRKGLIWKNA